MAPVRLITNRQLELLVEFAEIHRDIALNNTNGPIEHKAASKAWGELAKRLNSLGEGVIKTPEKWKRYWHLLKCRTKTKAADNRRYQGAVAESNKLVPLTDLEERIASVIGKMQGRTVRATTEVRIPVCDEAEMQHNMAADNETLEAASVENTLKMEYDCMKHELITTERCDASTHEMRNERELLIEQQDPLATKPLQATIRPIPLRNLVPSETRSARSRDARTRSRNISNHDNVPRWVYSLEERRIAVEERLADAVSSLAATSHSILGCFQQMSRTQALIVELLRRQPH